MFLVSHAISQDHMAKRSCHYMDKRLLIVSHYPFRFSGHRHCGSEDKIVLVCQMISQAHVT